MKRTIAMILIVLLLAGCTPKPPETKPTDPTHQTEPSAPNPGDTHSNQVAQQTKGAVRVCALPQGRYFALYPMGSNMLAVGTDVLAVLHGDMGPVTCKTEIPMDRVPMDSAATGVAYYRADTGQVILRNPQLQQVGQLRLPEDMTGMPVISLTQKEIYYSNGKELRALHMDTGISRLLRQLNGGEYVLQAACFNGTVLVCEGAENQYLFISAATGQTLASGADVLKMVTWEDRFFAHVQDGFVRQLVFGTNEENVACLQLPQTANALPALAMQGVVRYEEAPGQLNLSFYDLNTGRCTAKTELPNTQLPTSLQSDGTYIWMIAEDRTTGGQMLYRWDIAKSKTNDSTVYTGPYYTAENPDTQGLELCRKKAYALETQYHVDLMLWKEAANHTGSYAVVLEYHPQVLAEMLEQLETAFAKFPPNFFRQTLDGNKIHIALVRSIEGGEEAVQFWSEGEYGMILTPQGDIVKSFYRCVAYGIDSHVLGNSRDFDTWNQLNPKGFAYSYGETLPNLPQYLAGENRAFTDPVAMSYPHEDRCRVFCNAMLEGNKEMFRSETMQAKLLKLCKGIREAYGLEKSTETYAWEQYLEESLAYKK